VPRSPSACGDSGGGGRIGTVLFDRRMLVLLGLGFSAGLPLLLTGFTLRQRLAELDIPLGAIGATALIGLAYTLKFLWAPILDHVRPPLRLGRRRGWLLLIQPALALAILGLGSLDPRGGIGLVAAAAVGVAFLSASQDIVVDALRIEMLEPERQALGLAAYIWGYRGALLVANAGALFLVEPLGWSGSYAVMGGLMGVGVLASLAAPEPAAPPALATTLGWGGRLRLAVVEPFLEFLTRPGAWWILAFVGLFKLGEALAGTMVPPFYRELGFTREQVAAVSSGFGLVATLLGYAAGGFLVVRIGIGRALVLTGLGQMLSNLMYVALAEFEPTLGLLWAQVGIEAFTDGLADAAYLGYLSSLTSRAFTATQYALLSSLASLPLRTLSATSGWMAEGLGWSWFFVGTTAAALPAMAIMLVLLRRFPPDQASVREEPSAGR